MVGGGSCRCEGRRIEDFLRMLRETRLSTGSLETLTTRCDILRSIVPVLKRGDSAEAGDRERWRLDGERPKSDPEEYAPASKFRRLSPSIDPLRPGVLGNCTLSPEILLPGDLPLSCLCPCGDNIDPDAFCSSILEELVSGNVSSSSVGAGEKKAGPSSNWTDTISSMLSLFVRKLGSEGRLPRLIALFLAGRGGVSSIGSSSSSAELVSALKLKPAKPIAAWNAPRSSTGEYAASSSSSGIRSCCPVGEVTNATGDKPELPDGGLGARAAMGAYLLFDPPLDLPECLSPATRSLNVRRWLSCLLIPTPCSCDALPF